MNDAATHNELITALSFYIDMGVDVCVEHEAQDHSAIPTPMIQDKVFYQSSASQRQQSSRVVTDIPQNAVTPFLGKSDAYDEAVKLAKASNTLDDLRNAIASFDGIALKKTATNMVFSDGNPKAKIMLIGEAPGADEDRTGKPFSGESGRLLDKILACIGFSRYEETLDKSVYVSNILNWRPPGDRTPNSSEIEVSLPFIERHIQLINPEILIFCGGVSAQALTGNSQSISKLRKKWHDYSVLTKELSVSPLVIPAIATYHPSYLLRTPTQKRAVWEDMLTIVRKMHK